MRKNFTRCRVLVVDDECLIRWAVCEALADAGYEPAEAGDGASAVRKVLDDGHIDAILLDYRLPDSSDLTLLATLKRLVPSCPVIMMTAFSRTGMAEDALRLGAYRVVNKPFELSAIVELVRTATTGDISSAALA